MASCHNLVSLPPFLNTSLFCQKHWLFCAKRRTIGFWGADMQIKTDFARSEKTKRCPHSLSSFLWPIDGDERVCGSGSQRDFPGMEIETGNRAQSLTHPTFVELHRVKRLARYRVYLDHLTTGRKTGKCKTEDE